LPLFLIACASQNTLKNTSEPRQPASTAGSISNLKALEKILSSSDSNCGFKAEETYFVFGQDPNTAEKVQGLAVRITPNGQKEVSITIAGEPEVIYTKYFSSSAKRDKYTQVFKGYFIESGYSEVPGKFSMEYTDEGKIRSFKIYNVSNNLDAKGPQYNVEQPCKFQ
jgi:hypothetical protein